MISIPRTVRTFARVFADAGHELFVVGGAVRDALLNREVTDFDFATSATPEEVQSLFRRTIPTGIKHGTVTVLFHGDRYEVTTYRVDGDYQDHRRPDTVRYTRSLREDLARRDFTVNAMAVDPSSSRIIDPFDGRGDLARRTIRTVGDADRRFGEDALRMVRAARFSATLQFSVDPLTQTAMSAHAREVAHVAGERIFQEFTKLMTAPRPSVGWRLLKETGLLHHILPELLEEEKSIYDDRSLPPIFDHLVAACDCAPRDNPALRWAALLHDAAKPQCADMDERGLHFHGHDERSAEVATAVLNRLRSSRDLTNHVAHLIRHHMYDVTATSSQPALRRFLARVGSDAALELTALRRADICGKTGRAPTSPDLAALERRLEALIDERPPITVKDLAVNGKDLMTELEMSAGPTIGIVLNELLQSVIDDPSLNDRERLLTIARRFVHERLDMG